MANVYLSIGSVSSGTLRTEDLLDSFEWELSQIARKEEHPGNRAGLEDLCREIGGWLSIDPDDRDEDEGSELVVSAIDYLNEYCPPYCYFGTAEGDGAEFGCWPMVESMEEDLVKVNDPAELDGLDESEAMVVNDHGNVSYYARKASATGNGEWEEIWSCV